jgi:hypothetical protein
MMLPEWIEVPRAWVYVHQQLAGALIGFTGVILALLWNARQSREV